MKVLIDRNNNGELREFTSEILWHESDWTNALRQDPATYRAQDDVAARSGNLAKDLHTMQERAFLNLLRSAWASCFSSSTRLCSDSRDERDILSWSTFKQLNPLSISPLQHE